MSQPTTRPTYQREAFALGKAVRELREARQLTQNRLAKLAGFDHSYISRIESGEREVTRAGLERIIKALGLPTHEAEGLRIRAGYLPAHWSDDDLALLSQLGRALADAPLSVKLWAQLSIRAMVAHAERMTEDEHRQHHAD